MEALDNPWIFERHVNNSTASTVENLVICVEIVLRRRRLTFVP
jgi:hypothetical protein